MKDATSPHADTPMSSPKKHTTINGERARERRVKTKRATPTKTVREVAAGSSPVPTSGSRSRSRARAVLFLVAALVALLFRPVRYHAAGGEVLARFADPKAEVGGLEVKEVRVPTWRGDVRAKIFLPEGARESALPGVVLVHGVQFRGIDEPRIVRFARSLAATGLVVLTPEISELADYHVDPRSIETIGASLEALAERTGRARVGLLGMSFGGGLSLLTAANPKFRDHVGFVVAVGAHDDLARILRFFATGTIAVPDGTVKKQKAHDYGAMVLAYNRVDDFFPTEDREEARHAMRAWLQEKRDAAREHAKKTSPASNAKLEEIFTTDLAGLRPELLRIVDAHQNDDTGVSPHGHLEGLRAPVYLLHGADDSVIPASETLWLAGEIPHGLLKQAVVSCAIRHVEMEGKPSLAQQWELVHFMGEVLAETSHL